MLIDCKLLSFDQAGNQTRLECIFVAFDQGQYLWFENEKSPVDPSFADLWFFAEKPLRRHFRLRFVRNAMTA